MSNLLLGYVFQLGLEPSLKLVYMGLADAADDDGGSCYPSVARLAQKASISERQAQRNLKILRADGWCSIVGNEAGGRQTRRYRINVQKLREKADEAMEALRGDKLSPLKKAAEGRHLRHRKGDTDDTPAVPSTSPELPVELSAEVTTTAPDLIWPLWFDADQRVVVLKWMDGLDQILQQKLFDEFQGKMEKGPPRVPMDWFRGTIEKARTGKDGGFVPSLGLAVAARRARRAEEAADKEAARAAATEAQERKNELQALLDQMDDARVRALLAGVPGINPGQIDKWLQDGRPSEGFIAAMARTEIAKTSAGMGA